MPYHHYVSAFHLSEFTEGRDRTSQIHVHDLETQRRYVAPVNRAGGEGAYNKVDVEGFDPEEVERWFTRIESAAAPVLRGVIDSLRLPAGADLNSLIEYFALLAVNNPSRRQAANDAEERVLNLLAQMMVERPDRFATDQAQFLGDGVPLLGNATIEEVREMMAGGSLTYRMTSSDHLRGISTHLNDMSFLLKERVWQLLIVPPGLPDLICGDHPVVLMWTSERAQELYVPGQRLMPPGYADSQTELTVPLGRRVGMVGTVGGASRRMVASEDIVGEANRRQVRYATRFVYSPGPSFLFTGPGRRLYDSSSLF